MLARVSREAAAETRSSRPQVSLKLSKGVNLVDGLRVSCSNGDRRNSHETNAHDVGHSSIITPLEIHDVEARHAVELTKVSIPSSKGNASANNVKFSNVDCPV